MIDTKKIKNKHGFTLVEIIVVLVILAILAAVAIPSVLGYVDEAKKAGIIQEAHVMQTNRHTLVLSYTSQSLPEILLYPASLKLSQNNMEKAFDP